MFISTTENEKLQPGSCQGEGVLRYFQSTNHDEDDENDDNRKWKPPVPVQTCGGKFAVDNVTLLPSTERRWTAWLNVACCNRKKNLYVFKSGVL